MVVLGYINNHKRRFHTFVTNRVQRIHCHTSPNQWRYIPTAENPADHTSRGLTASELLSSNWLTGPSFLWEREIVHQSDTFPKLSVGDPEVKRAQTLNIGAEEQRNIADQLLKYSSWPSAVRAIACIQRRINTGKVNGFSTVQDREKVEHFIIMSLQSLAYKDDLILLSTGN